MTGSYYYFVNKVGESSPEIGKQELARFKSQLNNSLSDNEPVNKYRESQVAVERTNPLVLFNPNSDSFKELLKKGVPYSAVKNIVNYREKGGVFRKKADLKKLYSIDPNLYAKLSPYIMLPESLSSFDKTTATMSKDTLAKSKQIWVVDINSANAEELQKVRGIGAFYAKTIIEQRTKLGGFHNAKQLDEVYGLTEETIVAILPQLRFDPTKIIKIPLNNATYEELVKHPYISYKEARAIVNYREQHGDFASLKTIQNLHILKGKDISRLLPYLDLN